jgi:hypothetical protein
VPQQIRTGLNGYDGLTYRALVNPAIPAAEIIAGTRALLQGSDGMLGHMNTLMQKIEEFFKEGTWPPTQPTAPTLAPAPQPEAKEIPVEM